MTKQDFSLLKKMLHDKQLFHKVPFQSTKYRNKELCADNIKTLGNVYCPTRRVKSLFTFQPIKPLVFPTVKSAKPAATLWIFLWRIKNWQICCLVVMEPIVLQERRVATTKKKNHLLFWRNFSTNHNQAHPNANKKKDKSSPNME